MNINSNTETEIIVRSKRTKDRYRINRFIEYSVDVDLETDTHQLNMVFSNPMGVYTGVFNKYDDVWLYLGGKLIIDGVIDEMQYIWDLDSSVIRIVGRDLIAPLLDNDALPATKNNVKPKSYIEEIGKKYGINKFTITDSMPTIKKLEIGHGESEKSVIDKIISHKYKKIWTHGDTLIVGDWATDKYPIYRATRGLSSDKSGIPIKSLSIRDSGQENISEYIIYKSEDKGKNKTVASFKNEGMTGKIQKRRIGSASGEDEDSGIKKDYKEEAKRHVKDTLRSSIELVLDIKTNKEPILVNNCIEVVDILSKVNDVFFIRGVNYKKGFDGSMTTLTCIPSDNMLNKILNGAYVNGLRNPSIEEKLKTMKVKE